MLASRGYRGLTCIICAGLAALAVAVSVGPIGADGTLLDLLIGSRSVVFPVTDLREQEPVAVIALDQRSLAEPELARYPRAFLAHVWADVLDGVFQAGARAVAFDLLFSYSASQFAPNFDAPFLAALNRYRDRIVLARSAATLPAPPFLAAVRNEESALGLAELPADRDGRYRRVPAAHETQSDGAVPSLAAALLGRANVSPLPREVVLAPRRHLERLPTYAVVDVLRCAKQAPEALRLAFRDKIILVGGTLPEEDRKVSSDRFLAPLRADAPPLHPCGLRRLGASAPDSPGVPGVFLHAAAVEAVVGGGVTSTAPTIFVAALAAALAAIGAALAFAMSPWNAATVIALIAALVVGTATGMLASDIWVPVALPLVALMGAPVSAYLVRYLAEERMRRRIQHAFCHYLAPTIVQRLAADASALRLGGELREVTVMFADLSGFTAVSRKVAPEVLVGLANRYLGLIVERVEATGGYVDKFIGDAVMALWGAPAADPRHAANGIRAAMAAVARIQQEGRVAAAQSEIGFSVKIGLNSGPVVVGNVGTENRYNYTAIGETVNLASRLEMVPAIYGCQIAIGPRTAELAQAEFVFRELDTIRVKGGDEPFPVFEPLAERALATPEQVESARRYAEALAEYRAMRFAEAGAIWDELARAEGPSAQPQHGALERGAGPALTMAERARSLAANPPTGPWDGAWILPSK